MATPPADDQTYLANLGIDIDPISPSPSSTAVHRDTSMSSPPRSLSPSLSPPLLHFEESPAITSDFYNNTTDCWTCPYHGSAPTWECRDDLIVHLHHDHPRLCLSLVPLSGTAAPSSSTVAATPAHSSLPAGHPDTSNKFLDDAAFDVKAQASHDAILDASVVDKKNDVYICACKVVYASKGDLDRHINEILYLYWCFGCNMRFKRKDPRIRHWVKTGCEQKHHEWVNAFGTEQEKGKEQMRWDRRLGKAKPKGPGVKCPSKGPPKAKTQGAPKPKRQTANFLLRMKVAKAAKNKPAGKPAAADTHYRGQLIIPPVHLHRRTPVAVAVAVVIEKGSLLAEIHKNGAGERITRSKSKKMGL